MEFFIQGILIEEVLNDLSKEKLINIILDITRNDKTLENDIIFRYSKDKGIKEIDKCKRLIHSIVKKYTGREGFITYRFAYDIEVLLEKVKRYY